MKNYSYRAIIPLQMIYPDKPLESDKYKIETFTLSEEEVRFEKTQSYYRGNQWTTRSLKSDYKYVKLIKKGEGTMMSDTPMERYTNSSFIQKANGDVLIFGLGLGLIILPILNDESVKSITVIELHQDLIDLVEPILKEHDENNKLKVIQGDCFEYHKNVPKEKKWDCIYGDIWISIEADNYTEMKKLTKNFTWKVNRDNPNWFIDHWLQGYVKEMARKETEFAYSLDQF